MTLVQVVGAGNSVPQVDIALDDCLTGPTKPYRTILSFGNLEIISSPVNEGLHSLLAQPLDVERHHALGQREEPAARLQVAQRVRTGRHDHVAALSIGGGQGAGLPDDHSLALKFLPSTFIWRITGKQAK